MPREAAKQSRKKQLSFLMSDELWSCHVALYNDGTPGPVSEFDICVSFTERMLHDNIGLRIHDLKIDELAEVKRTFVATAIGDVLSQRFAFSRCQKSRIKPQHAATPPRPLAISAPNGALVWLKE
jgi:hypothetical protein